MSCKVQCPICLDLNTYDSHFNLENHLERDHTKTSLIHILIRKYITGERHG